MSKWDAKQAILRPARLFEHQGLNFQEAIKRVADLTYAADCLGVSKHLLSHMKQIAPCLVCDVGYRSE